MTAAAQGAKFVLNLTSAAVLARLLTPSDFGLVSMALAIVGLLKLFKDAGLSTATVQRETITQDQVSNLFWINVALGVVVCLLCAGMSPVVAAFYHDPRIVGIMVGLSVTFLLTGATVQHQALLMRQMRFSTVAFIDVVSMVGSVAVGCCMALLGYGYWSLVVMQICLALVGLVGTWLAAHWLPSMPKANVGMRPLLSFGVHLTFADLVGIVSANSDSILVGRFFGAASLGFYSRASVLLARPLEQLLSPLSAVMTPVLSRLNSDPERYRRTFLRSFDTLALLTFPFAALGLVLAEPLVLLVLGPKWEGSVPLFAGFSLVAVSLPLSIATSWLFMSQGRGKDLLHTYMMTGSVTVGAYLTGLMWGPLGVVMGLAIAGVTIRMPILYYLAGRRGPVSTTDLWTSFLAHLPCWCAVVATGMAIRPFVADSQPIVQVLICAPPAAAASLSIAMLFKRSRGSVLFAWEIGRNLIAGRMKAESVVA